MDDHTADGTPGQRSRRAVLATIGAATAGTLGGCLGGRTADDTGDPATAATTAASGSDAAWQSIELDTVRGGETFTIDSLDPPTIVHSFAVWCPKCERLSNEVAALADSHTLLGLNTDPNEDAEKVRSYAVENEFGWRFAVAPTALTDALVADFGPTVLNAPSTPVIVVCGDGTATVLSGADSTRPTIASTAEEC